MANYDDLPFAPLPGRGANTDQYWQALVYQIFTTLRVGQPATVVKWTASVPAKNMPPTVDVRLDFERARSINSPDEVDASKGERLVTRATGLLAIGPRPVYRFRPYVSPSVGAAFSMRGPIAEGTTGLYVVVDRSIDGWINKGGPIDPADAVKHDLNDGFFVPLVYHGRNTPNIPTNAHQLGPDDGNAGLEITATPGQPDDRSIRLYTDGPNMTVDAATLIKLGATAALGVARLTDTVAADATMTTWIAQAQVVLAGAAALLALPVPVPPTDFGVISSASNKVQAE